MIWHDCKTDPPKKDGWYVLSFKNPKGVIWDSAFYSKKWDVWEHRRDEFYDKLYKWAEVDLSEVE